MVLAHPSFLLVTLFLFIYMLREIYGGDYKNYKEVWIFVFLLMLLAGGRDWVGADIGIYIRSFYKVGLFVGYDDIFQKAMLIHNVESYYFTMEWLYTFFVKFFYSIGWTHQSLLFFMAIGTLFLKFYSFEKFCVYPAMAMLLYMYPTFFTAEMGQMRQAFAAGILFFSFLFIQKRNLLGFLLCIYFAMGFHNSSVIFILAYWLVLLPMNQKRILIAVGISIIISPFELYNYLGVIQFSDGLDAHHGFTAHLVDDHLGTSKRLIKVQDLLVIFYLFLILRYEKHAQALIPYYEYMRNLVVVGICMHFFFRGHAIFGTRLTLIYLGFWVMLIPNLLASIPKISLRRSMHFLTMAFFMLNFYAFNVNTAEKGGFSSSFRNILFFWQ